MVVVVVVTNTEGNDWWWRCALSVLWDDCRPEQTHTRSKHTHTDIYISLSFFVFFFLFETSSTSCMTSWFCSSCCLVSLEFSFLSMTELIMTKTAIEYFKLTHPHNYMPACSLNQACVFWNSSIWQSGSAVGLMETVNNPHTCFVLYCCPLWLHIDLSLFPPYLYSDDNSCTILPLTSHTRHPRFPRPLVCGVIHVCGGGRRVGGRKMRSRETYSRCRMSTISWKKL